MQLKGRITISRVTGSEEYVSIRMEDDQGCCEITEARLDFASFGELITGLGHIKCDLFVSNLDKVGKKREHKTEQVEIPDHTWNLNDIELENLLSLHERDGWVGCRSDIKNMHKHISGTNKCIVSFERWV